MSARTFDLNKARKYGNIQIKNYSEHDGLYTEVLLHGNRIMLINNVDKWFEMTDCGWQTATTKTALNTALKQFRPDVSIYQFKGQWVVKFANGEDEACWEAVKGQKYGY